MRITVFCSANTDIDDAFFQGAQKLGTWIGAHGHTLVYGGADLGLMECIARAVVEAGGTTLGIVPSRLEENGHVSKYNTRILKCGSLTERIQIMINESDVFVALPGGIGTLDEVFSVVASRTIGYHDKPLYLYNINDFWKPTITLLDELQRGKMIRGDWHRYVQVIDSQADLEEQLT